MEEKKQKTIRIVGLIVLTILVIVGIVLTIYFVQKNDKKEYIKINIRKTVSLDKIDFTVNDVKFDTYSEEGMLLAIIEIQIDAKKDFKETLKNYKLSTGAEPFDTEGYKDDLNKGESSTFKVKFVVKDNQELLYLIYADKIKVALGEAHIQEK